MAEAASTSIVRYKKSARSYNPSLEQRGYDKLDSIWAYLLYRNDAYEPEISKARELVQEVKMLFLDSIDTSKINLQSGWNRSAKWAQRQYGGEF